jgi:hypothetical protein
MHSFGVKIISSGLRNRLKRLFGKLLNDFKGSRDKSCLVPTECPIPTISYLGI